MASSVARAVRCTFGVVVTLGGVLASAAPAPAQEFPTRAIRMVLPFPAGGGSDLVARIIAQKYSALLGQQVVVDNRAGASGNIAADIVAKAPGDGYTVLFANSSLSISPAIYKKLSYDPVRDLTAISMASSYPFALVAHPALPVKNVKDLVALAKSKPNSLDYSSAGTGTMSHMAMEMLRVKTGTRITHLPYKGAAPATVAVLTGESQVAFVVMPVAAPHINAGRLRGLGVAAKTRSAVVPNVPTMEEAGVPGHLALQWNGLFVPAKTPAVQDKLYREWVTAVKSPEVVQRIRDQGAEPGGNTPAEFSAFFKAETAKWADVAKQSGTKVD